jgi:hypothetical protein
VGPALGEEGAPGDSTSPALGEEGEEWEESEQQSNIPVGSALGEEGAPGEEGEE